MISTEVGGDYVEKWLCTVVNQRLKGTFIYFLFH